MKSEFTTSNSTLATHSDDEVLVRVEGVSKKFCRSLKRSLWYGLCDIGVELNPFRRQVAGVACDELRVTSHNQATEGGSISPATTYQVAYGPSLKASVPVTPVEAARDEGLRKGEFYAVRNVSFELRRGECLGLIGHNGAGKTTLLKMLNGLVKPDTGRIEMNGVVGALIALGAGFNPILTGRENIYINGAVLGLSKAEIDEKIEDIIDFAEIREFIDMPVQSYSSGMAVRLGFSVASSLNPDVLILDEVLAVGDVRFVVKCLNRVREMASRSAVILVSHNMQNIFGFCSRIILMDHGAVLTDTREPSAAIDLYHATNAFAVTRAGTGDVRLLSFQMEGGKSFSHGNRPVFAHGTEAAALLEFEVFTGIAGARLQINIADAAGVPVVAIPVLEKSDADKLFPVGRHKARIPLGVLDLNEGTYHISVIFRAPIDNRVFQRTDGLATFRVGSVRPSGARIVRPVIGHFSAIQSPAVAARG